MREGNRLRRLAVPVLALAMVLGGTAPASAAADSRAEVVIVLPGATSAEGIASGAGSTFYAGDLFGGDIFRGDVRRGTAQLFIDAPDGRMAVGMFADLRHHLLFVAGGFTGQAYVYDLRTGATVATYQLAEANVGMINDVVVTRYGAWFTNAFEAKLYLVPVNHEGVPGPARTLNVTGPAGDASGEFNLNGIRATPDGRTLLVAHSAHGRIYLVDPRTGSSVAIAGVDVPGADGIELAGQRLWVVHNGQVSRFRLGRDFGSGTLERVITSANFATPTTAALFGSRLGVVQAHFDTGLPPTSPTYEVVVVHA